jgi:GH15 family glucan-1,4-alpha-glucosidase
VVVVALALGLLLVAGAPGALGRAPVGSPRQAYGPPGSSAPSEFSCYNPFQANADYEAYGPTDVNAQAGNGRVTVGENAAGTLTVFKYPNPSYYNQVKYLATGRDAQGRAQPQFPNDGSFAGLRYQTRAGTGFSWLRDWSTTQTYDSADTAVPVTTYSSPAPLGITVTDIDVAVPGTSSFVREYWVTRQPGSPVSAARLVYYENFNPVATRLTYLPIADWCLTQLSDQHAAYQAGPAAIVNWWQGADQASGQPSAVALAIGWQGRDAAHQVGRDGYDPASAPGGAPDPYQQLAQAPYELGGAVGADGQTTGALAADLHFDAGGRAEARLIVSAAPDPAGALEALQTARSRPFSTQMSAEALDWRAWLAGTQLPADSDTRVVDVAKRSLITVRLAIDPETSAIVASSDTQGPYGEDWIRDGSFINQVLDRNGKTSLVTAHNLFYARIQTSATNPSPVRPAGNWAMASYGDGIDGAPIPWEIDETGLGIWALWDHAGNLQGAARNAYLQAVYPAIARAATFLTGCQDPTTGLQCEANEDDNPTPSESLHGAETVLLGLRSAVAAASALGDTGVQVAAWQARLARLDQAVAALYDPATQSYREGNATGNAYNVDYGDGGWLLWPVQFRGYQDATMRGEANSVRRAMDASLASAQGSYEGKALLGLAHAWSSPTSAQSQELHSVLRSLASAYTTNTGLFGEAWRRLGGNRPHPLQDMPHVWEHSLFYLSALAIDGGAPYRFEASDFYQRACASGEAPALACPAGTAPGARPGAPGGQHCRTQARGRARGRGRRHRRAGSVVARRRHRRVSRHQRAERRCRPLRHRAGGHGRRRVHPRRLAARRRNRK